MSEQETLIPKKRRGPAPTGQGTPIMVRLHSDLLAIIDAWIAQRPDPKPTRPEIIREALAQLQRRGGLGTDD